MQQYLFIPIYTYIIKVSKTSIKKSQIKSSTFYSKPKLSGGKALYFHDRGNQRRSNLLLPLHLTKSQQHMESLTFIPFLKFTVL